MSDIPSDIMKTANETSEAIIPSMCMTWDHSYGLQTPEERAPLERSMGQISYHEVRKAIAKAIYEERKRCARMAEMHDEDVRSSIELSKAILSGETKD